MCAWFFRISNCIFFFRFVLEISQLVPKKPEPRSFEPYRAGIFQQEYFNPNPYKTDFEDFPSKEIEGEKGKKEMDEKSAKIPFLPSNPAKKVRQQNLNVRYIAAKIKTD